MLRHVHRRIQRVGAALLARIRSRAPARSGGFLFFRKSNTELKNKLNPPKNDNGSGGVALEVALAVFHEAVTRYDAFCAMFSQTTRFLFHLASMRPMYLDLKALNKTLDDAMMRAGLDVSVDVEPEVEEADMTWKQLLDGDREKEEAHLSRITDANELPFDCDTLSNDTLGDIVLLKFELEFFKAGNSGRHVGNMNKVFSIVSCKIENSEVHVPDWYIPESELNYTRVVLEGMRGTVGTAHRGKWMNRKSVLNGGTASEMPTIRTIVVKCLHLDSDPDDILGKEVATWFSIDHPRILKLYGVSHCSHRALFVCEDAHNGPLQNYLTRQALRDERPEHQTYRTSLSQNKRFELWSMFVEAAEGLMFLHYEKKMVHGNLKRNNILVTSDGHVKLSDFGVGVTKLQNMYRSGQYSSDPPKQCNVIDALGWRACECRSFRARLSFQADIYSLGLCVLDVLLPESDDHDFASPPRPGDEAFDPLSVSIKRRLHRSDWELISGMCQAKPEDRLRLRDVIEFMKTLRDNAVQVGERTIAARVQNFWRLPTRSGRLAGDEQLDPSSLAHGRTDVADSVNIHKDYGGATMKGDTVELCDCSRTSADCPVIQPMENAWTQSIDAVARNDTDFDNVEAGDGEVMTSDGRDRSGVQEEIATPPGIDNSVNEEALTGDVLAGPSCDLMEVKYDERVENYGADVEVGDDEALTSNRSDHLGIQEDTAGPPESDNTVNEDLAGDALAGSSCDVTETTSDDADATDYSDSRSALDSSHSLPNVGGDTATKGVCNWEEEKFAVLPTREDASEQERRQVAPKRSTCATGNVPAIQKQNSPSVVSVNVFGDLMRNVLLNLKLLCDGMAESKDMCLCVVNRLQDIHHELIQMTSLREEESERKYRALALRYERFLKKYAHKKAISRLICMRKIVSQNNAFHGELDTVVSNLALSHLSLSTWRDDWEADRKKQEEIWTKACQPKGLLDMELKDDDARVEALVLLRYESSSYLSNLDDTVSKVVRTLCQRVEFERGLFADVCSVPRWFLPPYELECNDKPFVMGGYGAAYHGTWQGTDVVVKRLLYSTGGEQARGEFMKEVTIWSELNHPNIVRLLGACHVGSPFFVCQFANNGTLRNYLYATRKGRPRTWQLLHQAAWGLSYLHSRDVIHSDLKCDNILVGGDGTAMLTDFGLSVILTISRDPLPDKELGALRWKAPEILQAASGSSLEADVFSLAMAIVEAVTMAFPWCGLEDSVVRFHLGKGTRLPRPPEVFTDEQWAFVELMSAPVPSDRPAMLAVVEKLKKWAIDEEESNSCSNSTRDARVWRGLEELCALAPSNRPPLSDVIEMLKNSTAANKPDEATFQGAASPA
ncbi:hypothetical protein BBJ28_00000413 [Nothophytophthora sp. Chile5]|nr:hypothetical protein BBJ28_00000413 [Nothophytophthora sp. Chile5]